jgi:hypothetical protein
VREHRAGAWTHAYKEAHAVAKDLHAPDPRSTQCPRWCVGRSGQPHDVDDLYGVLGTHHDSPITTVELAGDDGSRIYVRASRFVPADGNPWPARIEVDWDIAEARHWSGERSVWLSVSESTALELALTVASIRAAAVNHADARRHRRRRTAPPR